MSKTRIRILFILSCALAGLSLGAGVGFGVAGLTHKVSIFVLSIGELLGLALLSISVTLLLFVGIVS